MAWIALGAAAISGAAGYMGQSKQAEAQSRRYHAAVKMLAKNMAETRRSYGQSEDILRGNLQTINKGYGQAAGHLSRYGQSARTGVLDQQKQQMGSMGQSLTSRGLYNTTLVDNAQRGIYADTSRRLAEIDESLGAMFSNLEMGKTQATLGARSALAGFYPARQGAITQSRNDLAQLMMGTIPQSGNAAGGIGDLFSLFMLQKMMGGGDKVGSNVAWGRNQPGW